MSARGFLAVSVAYAVGCTAFAWFASSLLLRNVHDVSASDLILACLVVAIGGAFLLLAVETLRDVVRDTLACLRERRSPPTATAAAPAARPVEGVTDGADDVDRELALILEPFRRRSQLRVLSGGDGGEAA